MCKGVLLATYKHILVKKHYIEGMFIERYSNVTYGPLQKHEEVSLNTKPFAKG